MRSECRKQSSNKKYWAPEDSLFQIGAWVIEMCVCGRPMGCCYGILKKLVDKILLWVRSRVSKIESEQDDVMWLSEVMKRSNDFQKCLWLRACMDRGLKLWRCTCGKGDNSSTRWEQSIEVDLTRKIRTPKKFSEIVGTRKRTKLECVRRGAWWGEVVGGTSVWADAPSLSW